MLSSRNEGGGVTQTLGLRNTAFGRLKLLTVIDQLLSGLVDVIAGTGRRTLHSFESDGHMNHDENLLTIDSPDGWVFAYEGGAHILFRHTQPDSRFEGKLLRLAKWNQHTLPILKKHQAVQDTFLPLLTTDNDEDLVVPTELVKIGATVLGHLQTDQVETNTKRGSTLDLEETHGTLLEDLNADPSVLLLDFKPKWLSQSPTAPKDANTCRTCALRRLRKKYPKTKPCFCPLDLSSGKKERVYRAVTALLSEESIYDPVLSAQITEHILTSSLIPTLLKAQTSPQSSLATKMTLRDCTLFVQIPRELLSDTTPSSDILSPAANATQSIDVNGDGKLPSGSRRIRIVIADLDEKSEADRGAYWQSLEEELIAGGYYVGEGKLDDRAENCDLSDNVWTADQVKWNGVSE